MHPESVKKGVFTNNTTVTSILLKPSVPLCTLSVLVEEHNKSRYTQICIKKNRITS